MWNPLLELFFVVEIDLAKIALSCHFALDLLCYKEGAYDPVSSGTVVHGPYFMWHHLSPLWHRDLFVADTFATTFCSYLGTAVTRNSGFFRQEVRRRHSQRRLVELLFTNEKKGAIHETGYGTQALGLHAPQARLFAIVLPICLMFFLT